MNRKLHNHFKKSFLIIASILGIIFQSSLLAQMSGSYTIDASTAASSTNFQNWASFWQSLQGLARDDGGATLAGGVSGAVDVSVKSDLTESKKIEFPAISGMSSTNTVTIDGGSKYVQFAATNEVISFTGGDYFTIKNLTVRNTATGSGIQLIRFSNASDYNTINSCTLEFSALTSGSTSAQAYVSFASNPSSLTATTSSNNGTYNTISSCLMRTTNTNSPGPGYAIMDQQGTSSYSSTATNNTISGNTIQNFYQYAFYNRYTNGENFINNDISRANTTTNNASSQLYGVYTYYTYAANRSTSISGNNFHDLPFAGASASQGYTSTSYLFYGYYNYGSNTYRFEVKNNNIKNIRCNSTAYISYFYYNYYADVVGNTVESFNNNGSNTSAYFYGWYFYYGQETKFSNNTIKSCSTAYYTYYTYLRNHSDWNNCEENVIDGNVSGYYTYCIYPYYGNWRVNRNKVTNNKINGSYGYIYCVAPYYIYDVEVTGNLIYNNVGQYGMMGLYVYSFNSGNYKAEIYQNTIISDQTGTSYPYNYAYGLYVYCYYHQNVRVKGNVVRLSNSYGGYPLYSYNTSASNYKVWDYNTFWVDNVTNPYFYLGGAGSSSWSAFRSANTIAGKNEYYLDSKFADPSNGDFRSNVFENQNNVPTEPASPKDITGASRNLIMSDRGAQENAMDIQAVSTNFTVPSSVCAGYTVSGGTTITLKNTFATDTAKNFNVAYSVNGKNKVSETVTSDILTGQNYTYTFSQGLQLNTLGNNRIAIFIDIPDDNTTNDSFIFNTFVKPAPGGGKYNFSAKPTWAVYQYGKPNDVTVVNQPVIYDINSPRAFSNSDYGTSWTASVSAEMADGTPVTGASLAPASGSADLEVTYVTSNTALEDEMLTIKVKITDLTNGCDTILSRKVLIYPTISPDFKFPAKICDGDAVLFENLSTVKSGNMEFEWDFGTGNPADITAAPEPVFQFPGPGNYKVKMTAKTLPYGFPAWDSVTLNVGPIPTVGFTKVNACEGKALVFTNQTTPSNSTYDWDFGDNTTHSIATSPTHTYALTGAYTVTLKANLNGCIAETSQRVYQFDKPKADFSLVSGKCDNEQFEFGNASTIKGGLFGNNWDFNDGTVSTEVAPKHTFTSFGSKAVKLVVTSEFGCKDSLTKSIVVRESPVATFINDPACSLTPTTFTNTTNDVPLTNAIYAWDFGDGGTSSAKSPVHGWSNLGPKTVVLTVSLDNGCKSSTSSVLSVGVQPKANFDAQNVCAGNPVIFENNTIWAQGNITFSWDFGDITTSSNSDPQKTYATSVTTTYNVTLKATIAGGCSDQITKQVTVNEAPQTCDFVANPDYAFGFHGMKLEPKNGAGVIGAQANVTYTWVFNGGGTQTGPSTQYNFQDDGSYKVTMRARVDATGCECSKTMDVVMNRNAVKDLTETGVAVYPNPNNGQFNIALTQSFGSNVQVVVTNMAGKVVKEWSGANNGMLNMNASDLADGIYTVSVRSGDHSSSSRINISK